MYNSENIAEYHSTTDNTSYPSTIKTILKGIRKTMNQIEERQNSFPKEKCTIVDFLLEN
jgi:hypothetical protein